MVEIKRTRVLKIAETHVNSNAVRELMKEYGSAAERWYSRNRRSTRSDSERLIEIAGRVCYRSFGTGLNPNITKIRTESKDYFENVLRKGDGSILEHATVTFGLMWISRVFTHELVRHRAGTAFSQESHRYVRLQNIPFPKQDYWLPRELSANALREFSKALKEVEIRYQKIQTSIPWQKLNFEQKKKATSAIRRILPQGTATVIIFTANHRTLRWLIEMRTDPAAELEIRTIFGEIAEICIKDYPLIYGDFLSKRLDDGTLQYKPTLRSKV